MAPADDGVLGMLEKLTFDESIDGIDGVPIQWSIV